MDDLQSEVLELEVSILRFKNVFQTFQHSGD